MTSRPFIALSLPLLRPHNLNRYRHLSYIARNLQPHHPQKLFNQRYGRNQSNLLFRFMHGGVDDSVKTLVPKSVPVNVAHKLLQSGYSYLDVRTPEEFKDGHVPGAINIPYMFSSEEGMKKNPKFLEQVLEHFGRDTEMIIGCRSGKRSLMAASDLSCEGFKQVTDIAGGYLDWKQNGLPTE